MVTLNVNGKTYKVDLPAESSLLWTIRDHLKLTGTKFGCGIGECGGCTCISTARRRDPAP